MRNLPWRQTLGRSRAASAWGAWNRIVHARNMPLRIAFYAPLKSPTHGTPSGDRRVAGLLMDALARAGRRAAPGGAARAGQRARTAARRAVARRSGRGAARSLVHLSRVLQGAGLA